MGLKKGAPDMLIFFVVLLLLAIGIIMVFSASYYDTIAKDPYYYLRKQLTWGALSLAAMFVMLKIDFFRLKPFINPVFALTLLLLVAVLIPGVGTEVKGSQRWIDLGFTNLQPSEVMKFVLVLFLAKDLSNPGKRLDRFFSDLGPYLVIIGVIGALIMKEPDLGTTIAITITAGVILFAAGLKWLHVIVLGVTGVAAVAGLIIQEPYRLNRIIGYLDPWAHASKEGYQTVNSLYALGSGGLFGMGLGNSRQKLDFLPEQHTDFIFAILGEELGFVGAFLVVMLFFLLAWRGYRAALRCPDLFGSYLAAGITTAIVFQAFINMGVVTGLLPVTGISLPFISYGGSSLLLSMIGIGMLLNISRYGSTL